MKIFSSQGKQKNSWVKYQTFDRDQKKKSCNKLSIFIICHFLNFWNFPYQKCYWFSSKKNCYQVKSKVHNTWRGKKVWIMDFFSAKNLYEYGIRLQFFLENMCLTNNCNVNTWHTGPDHRLFLFHLLVGGPGECWFPCKIRYMKFWSISCPLHQLLTKLEYQEIKKRKKITKGPFMTKILELWG